MVTFVLLISLHLSVTSASSCESGSRTCASGNGHDASSLLQKTYNVHQDASTQTLNASQRALISKRDGDANLCIKGHVVPELFIIGAQKAGTTSLSIQLFGAPAIAFGKANKSQDLDYKDKEAHIFEKDDQFERGVNMWLERYPDCTADKRIVSVDATPNYLAEFNKVPARIRERYGDQSKRLKFVVILRDPISRMHSAFYHYKRNGASWGIAKDVMDNVFHKSFEEYIELLLLTNGSGLDDSDPLFNSLYTKQLDPFLEHFDVTIAPFKKAVGNTRFAEYILEMLGLPPARLQINEANSFPHPSLKEDLSPQLRDQVQALIDNVTGAHRVGQVLAKQRKNAPHLFGFSGDQSSADDIAKWLLDAW